VATTGYNIVTKFTKQKHQYRTANHVKDSGYTIIAIKAIASSKNEANPLTAWVIQDFPTTTMVIPADITANDNATTKKHEVPADTDTLPRDGDAEQQGSIAGGKAIESTCRRLRRRQGHDYGQRWNITFYDTF
jgi:hypothetical protein